MLGYIDEFDRGEEKKCSLVTYIIYYEDVTVVLRTIKKCKYCILYQSVALRKI